MYILKPLKLIRFTKDDIGTVEEVIRETRLVDKGIEELKRFSPNAPSFEPERRQFLKHAAVLAGLFASGQLLKACSTVQEPVQFQGKTYSNWDAYLMRQDLIRGPPVLIHSATGLPSDFEHHKGQWINEGWGAVDHDVPIGTPIVPTADAFRAGSIYSNGNLLVLHHRLQRGILYASLYAHLSDYTKIVSQGTPFKVGRGYEFRVQPLDKLKIVAFSGDTGVGPGGGREPPHLHFAIRRSEGQPAQPPGLDPFELGIDADKPFGGVDEYNIPYGGRPVFWDGKTEIVATRFSNRRKQKLQETLSTYPKRVRESDLENEIKEELLKRQNDPESLRDYLGWLVLRKHHGKDGKQNYRYPPGSLPYALMLEIFSRTSNQEFIAMLPFISPYVRNVYQQANPGVQF